ncbi:lysophospholipid acyltransferase family protein [Mucilaginibacter sp.]|jgi:1-acyl-sn-glycerol-3-phosphate acyltransferase|uniref:lysophospholipid acyltransferase family protein n=1 Tax=Mucilaginibacter sp. TaxID=1882438 RepID=UPI003561844A
MKKLLGYILSPFVIAAFFLLLVIFHPIQWMCYNWGGYKAHKRSVDILNFFLFHTAYIMGSSVTFTNKYDLPLDRPMIFLANHQSIFDIPPLIYYLRKYHAKFISKLELTKGVPSISYNLKVGGGANIDRKDPRQSITELVNFANRMKNNTWSAVIFPEGTRSKDGKVKPFQSAGVATLLKKCPNALLVPIAIKDSWKMSRYPLNPFTRMRWTVLEPIEPGKTPADELVKEVEDRIRAVVE